MITVERGRVSPKCHTNPEIRVSNTEPRTRVRFRVRWLRFAVWDHPQLISSFRVRWVIFFAKTRPEVQGFPLEKRVYRDDEALGGEEQILELGRG